MNNELIKPTKILFSSRKTISLIIKNNGDFIVKAPNKCAQYKIYEFINKKAEWIIKKRKEQLDNTFKPLTFDKNESIALLGKPFEIVLTNNSRVKLNENQIFLPKTNSKLKLITFLKKFAKNYISDRLSLICSLFNFEYSNFKINSTKSCWGSCNLKNELHFTYKLIMCQEDVIDYIILHELCHTKIKNHSKQFWALVESCNPHYKVCENYLKKNRGMIEII